MSTFRIHPSIGVARVGNSADYVIAPETMAGQPDPRHHDVMGGLPIPPERDDDVVRSGDLRDANGALKRHAARFRIFAYDDLGSETWPRGDGVEVTIGCDVGGKKVTAIIWTVHVANKKANWFKLAEEEIQGIASFENGSLPDIRNPDPNPDKTKTDRPQPAPDQRIDVLNRPARIAAMTIDPGPRSICGGSSATVAFDRKTTPTFYDPTTETVVTLPGYPVKFPAFADMDLPSGPIETLGELKSDASGRLLVLGGLGRAAGWKIDGKVPVAEDVNNDQWFDDTSDGPVSATLIFGDGTSAEAAGAWVTTTDPSFAPQILNMVSAWDDIYDSWVRNFDLEPALYDRPTDTWRDDYKPWFDDQIAPIFRSAVQQRWVTNLSAHGISAHEQLATIVATDDPSGTELAGILPIFRNPFELERDTDPNSPERTNTRKMPLSLGDGYEAFLTLRKTQYHCLKRWSAGLGAFQPGGKILGPGEYLDKAALVNCLGGRFSPGIDVTFVVRDPAAYVQAWQTAGTGPFRVRRKALNYLGPLDPERPLLTVGYVPRHCDQDGLEPGDLSKFMAVPWHTDYNSCATHPPFPNPKGNRKVFWSWPAQRPVAVNLAADVRWVGDTREEEIEPGEKVPLSPVLGTQRWSVRGLGTDSSRAERWGRYQERVNILDNWHRVGVVLQSTRIDEPALTAPPGTTDGAKPVPNDWFLETSGQLRDTLQTPVVPFPNTATYLEQILPPPPSELDPRQLFHQLLNISIYPEVVEDARAFVKYWLAEAERISNQPNLAAHDNTHHIEFFPYSEQAFVARLNLIYQDLADAADNSIPGDPDGVVRSRADAVERIKQLAPFNLLDGAWVRNAGRAGPQDEVRALLFSVWMDELGGGDVAMHHCNIYRELCRSVGYSPPPIDSKDFAFDPTFIDSAFQVPAFQLAISQFTEEFFPEILGMTLRLEWCVLDLKPIRDFIRFYGIDPHFYVMHIAIDNPANGHGQRASEAIRLYLSELGQSGIGAVAVQQAWRRIWNGYVAFLSVGTFFEDFADHLRQRRHASLRERVIAMITEKATYASCNHQRSMLGPMRLDELFADPPRLLDALLQYGFLKRGDWQNSRMRTEMLDFQKGRMFRVFTDAEIALWERHTNSLGQPEPVSPAPEPVAHQMVRLVDELRDAQSGVPAHARAMLRDAGGVARSIAWWFEQTPDATDDFLRALADPGNGYVTPGHPENSRLYMELTAPTGPMGPVFDQPAPGGAAGTRRDVLFRWIKDGCLRPSTLLAMAPHLRVGRQPLRRRRVRGMGTTH